MNKEIVNAEKDTLRPNPHTSLILLASMLAVLEPVCWPPRKCTAAVAAALSLGISFDITAMPRPASSCSRRVRTSQDRSRCAFSGSETFLPSDRVVSEHTEVHRDAAGSLVCVVELKRECVVRSLRHFLSRGRRDLPWCKSIEDVDEKRGPGKRSEERTNLAGPEIAAEDDDQHDEQAKDQSRVFQSFHTHASTPIRSPSLGSANVGETMASASFGAVT